MERVEESMLHFHPFPQRKNKNDTVQTKVLIFLFNEKKKCIKQCSKNWVAMFISLTPNTYITWDHLKHTYAGKILLANSFMLTTNKKKKKINQYNL